jgi:hypothetical protein
MIPKMPHRNGSEEDLMGQLFLDKALHQALIDCSGAFDTDCPRVVVELSRDPQNSLTISPRVAQLMQSVCQ